MKIMIIAVKTVPNNFFPKKLLGMVRCPLKIVVLSHLSS